MAVAIMGGLIVATVLTLLALPAMYAAWFRVKRPAIEPDWWPRACSAKFAGFWLEASEPGSTRFRARTRFPR
jgi:hypothetical protein